MLQDQDIMSAVSKILQRSERQIDEQKVVEIFVDLGILSQINNRNNQIIYGRRGTGKTHVLRVVGHKLQQSNPKDIAVYVDCRTLGSSEQFTDVALPMQQRVVALLRDLIGPVYNALLEHIVSTGGDNAQRALDSLDKLIPSITEVGLKLQEEKRSISDASSSSNELSGNIDIKLPIDVSLGGKTTNSTNSAHSVEQKFTVISSDKIVFPSISETLNEVFSLTGTHIYLLIDEWSSLPSDIQPYLAEFVKRTILPIKEFTIKIAALEYRCSFSHQTPNGNIGFELGADISTAPDLDDYYVFDRNPERISNAYGEILLRHMSVELPDRYLRDKYNIKSGSDLGSKLFTQKPVLQELSRSCEGVIRDLINIFTKSFFDAQRRGRDTIDQKAIITGAREWFEQDKARSLSPEMNRALRRITDEVIGKRQARSFLMARDHERHPLIQRLIDARVLHQMQRGYADKDHPGIRYNIYSLDYGTYVDLLGTKKAPQIDLSEDKSSSDIVFPFDDKRSIRRIILDPAFLDPV